MKTAYFYLIYLYFFLFFISGTTVFAYENKNIVVLNSYHPGSTWTDDLNRGIRDVFSKETHISMYTEYLDTKRFNLKNYTNQLDLVYKNKYITTGIDLILCTDNSALDFIIEHYGESPYTCPVVYCGVTNYDEYNLDTLPFYGIAESVNFKEDIHHILQIIPKTKDIYYIFDQTETGNIYYQVLTDLKVIMKPNVNLHLINNIDINTISEFVSNLKKGSVIRYINTHKDKYGEPVNDVEVGQLIAKNANVPVMAGQIGLDIDGFLGGLMNIGYKHGSETARLATKILQNSKDNNLRKLYFSEPEFYIDYREMKKNDIKVSDLPEDTILLNSPTSLYFKYRYQIFAISAFVVFLMLSVVLLILNNIRRKKNQLQMLRAKQKAEESDNLKSAFLANMSHEIRTPLNSIVGFSTLLAERYQHDETCNKYIGYITSSTNSLLNLINDILDISKIEVGQLEIQYRVVDINKELDNLYSIFDHELFESGKHAVELKFSPGIDDELFIKTDPTRVQQIMTNLLTNAIKFTAEGEIEFGYKLVDDELLFFCFDTGKGMHTEHQEKIFKRFVKLDSPENSNEKGTGLGLAITKNLVELLGGRIWVESEPGIGSSFYFTLPIKT